MRGFKILVRFGWVLIACAVPIAVFAPGARPDWRGVFVASCIAALAGLGSGIIVRYVIPLRTRLKILSALSPRVGAWVARRHRGQ